MLRTLAPYSRCAPSVVTLTGAVDRRQTRLGEDGAFDAEICS